MSESPNWSSSPSEPLEEVTLVCEAHGNLGNFARRLIDDQEEKHRTFFGCYFSIFIINLANEELIK